jgi:hypothetical protein
VKVIHYVANGIYWLACALAVLIVVLSLAALGTPSLDAAPPLFAGMVALIIWSYGWLTRRVLMWFSGLVAN